MLRKCLGLEATCQDKQVSRRPETEPGLRARLPLNARVHRIHDASGSCSLIVVVMVLVRFKMEASVNSPPVDVI